MKLSTTPQVVLLTFFVAICTGACGSNDAMTSSPDDGVIGDPDGADGGTDTGAPDARPGDNVPDAGAGGGPTSIACVGDQCVCPDGDTCLFTCPGGACNFDCQAGSICTTSCEGGACALDCADGALCTSSCTGGNCSASCSTDSVCDLSCEGEGCSMDCASSESCSQDCEGNCTATCQATLSCEQSCEVADGCVCIGCD